MPLMLKHTSNIRTPEYKNEPDELTRKIFEQFNRLLNDSLKNIYDDLVRASTDRVDTLPTAGKDYLGRVFLKTNTGADDTMNICIWDDNAEVYKWQEITLS